MGNIGLHCTRCKKRVSVDKRELDDRTEFRCSQCKGFVIAMQHPEASASSSTESVSATPSPPSEQAEPADTWTPKAFYDQPE